MKKSIIIALAVGLPLVALAQTRNLAESPTIQALNGAPTYLGTLTADASTSITNGTLLSDGGAGASFSIPSGQFILIQCDAAAYLLPVSASNTTVTTANGVKVIADEKYYAMLKSAQRYIAALSASGNANCKVWRVD